MLGKLDVGFGGEMVFCGLDVSSAQEKAPMHSLASS